MDAVIACPLCSQPGFSDVDSLRLTLISASTRRLVCPICQEVLLGLDKLTIHLVSHSFHDHLVQACFTSNVSSPLLTILKGNETPRESQNQFHIPLLEVLRTNASPITPQYILFNVSSPEVNQPANSLCQSPSKPVETCHSEEAFIRQPSTMSSQKLNLLPEFLPRTTNPCLAHEQKVPQNISVTNETESEMPAAMQQELDCHRNTSHSCLSTMTSKDAQDELLLPSFTPNVAQDIGNVSHVDTGDGGNDAVDKEVELCKSPEHAITKQDTDIIDSVPMWSCDICGLTFKDESIALLHQQLVHDLNIQQNVLGEELRPDPTLPSKYRQRKFSMSKQIRESSNSLHRFPCHLCSKVFRMRGSLMVHMRVAHSPATTGVVGSEPVSIPSSSWYSLECTEKFKFVSANPSVISQTSMPDSEDMDKVSSNSVGSPSALNFPKPSKSSLNSLEEGAKERCFKTDLSSMVKSSVKPASAIVVKDISESDSVLSSCSNIKSPTSSPGWSPTSPPGNAIISSASGVGGVFSCLTCNKTFLKESLLNQHLKSHEGKHWECDVCAKLFTTKYFLKKHKRLHTGEMPYTCGMCNKSFTFQQSYHKHLLYHSDDKPHACSECGRAFKELSTLHNHQRIHTGEKPWACETCGKCFRQRVSYLVHRRIHTGAMPYQCTACLKSFRYKVSQRTHKCTAQPPGDVVRQPDDLLQRLLLCSLRQSGTSSDKVEKSQSSEETSTPNEECTVLLKEQLQQLNIKQEKNHSKQHPVIDKKLGIPHNIQCESGRVKGCDDLKRSHQDEKQTHQQECKSVIPLDCPRGFGVDLKPEKAIFMQENSQMCVEPYANEQLWQVFENQSSFRISNEDRNEQLSSRFTFKNDPVHNTSKPVESLSSSGGHSANILSQQQSTSITPSGDNNSDLLQDILSMVMSPAVSPSQSLQTNNPSEGHSEKYSWDADPGEELRHLLYGPFDSQHSSITISSNCTSSIVRLLKKYNSIVKHFSALKY